MRRFTLMFRRVVERITHPREGMTRAESLLTWTCVILRVGLAFLFIYGGLVKVVDPKAFARAISPYGLVPEIFLPVVAVGLPIFEVVSGIALLLKARGSLAAVSALLVMFAAVLWYGVLNDLDIDCGCFGAAEIAGQRNLARVFYRDLGLIGVAAILYLEKWVLSRTNRLVWNK
jgi:uncharacterized membrane protein YphA (DoxX/SURF4 family)